MPPGDAGTRAQVAPELPRPLGHAQQPETLAGRSQACQPSPVILDFDQQAALSGAQTDRDARRTGMAGNVGQRFLADAIDRRRPRLGKLDIAVIRLEGASQFGTLGKLTQHQFQRRTQPEMIERPWTQILGNGAHRIDTFLRQDQQITDDAQQFGIGDPPLDALDVELHRGQHAADHIVQFAGNPRPLFFAHGVDVGGQFTQPLARAL